MKNQKTIRKAMVLLLSLALVFGGLPLLLGAMYGDDELTTGESGTITDFEPLPGWQVNQRIYPESGYDTIGDLVMHGFLPDTLTVTVLNSQLADVPVTWESFPVFDGSEPGVYTLTAAVGGGYTLADDLTPPVIIVTVVDVTGAATGDVPGEGSGAGSGEVTGGVPGEVPWEYQGIMATSAASTGTFDISTGTWTGSSANTTWDGTVLTVNNGADITVTGTATAGRRIEVNGTATITLQGVSITSPGWNNSPLLLNSGANLTLNLASGTNNTLTGVSEGAGIQAPDGTTLIINGPGSLTARGGSEGAGIGGGWQGAGGNITINGGAVNATGGGLGGAGIGGGRQGAGGIININGGIIVTTSDNFGAGIGGGSNRSGGIINISGGTVIATGGFGSAGIGGGDGTQGAGGTVTISGGSVTAIAGHTFARAIGGSDTATDDGTLTVSMADFMYWTNTGISAPGGVGTLHSITPFPLAGVPTFSYIQIVPANVTPALTPTIVTAVAGHGGTVTGSGGAGAYTVTPSTGYVIDQVFINGVSQAISNRNSFTHTFPPDMGAQSIFATFGYTVNFNQPANGTLTVTSASVNLSSGTLVRAGQVLNITAAPSAGYVLQSLYINGVNVTAAYSGGYNFTVGTSGDKRTLPPPSVDVLSSGAEIMAQFRDATLTVTGGGGTRTPNNVQRTDEGGTRTLQNVPLTDEGGTFPPVNVPQTGDDRSLILPIAALLFGSALIAGVEIRRRHKKKTAKQ